MIEWNLEKRDLKDLRSNPKNARKLSSHDGENLSKSLKKFGVCEPIVINQDNCIIGGHQRVRMLKKLGNKEVDVYVPITLLSEKEADELNIRLNKNQGKFDYDLLANMWDPDDLLEYGFTMEDLQLESLPPGEGEDEEKPKNCTLTVTFENKDDLEDAEHKLAELILRYQGAKYKVKIK